MNNHYWINKGKRAEQARNHTVEMNRRYYDEIQNSATFTLEYDETFPRFCGSTEADVSQGKYHGLLTPMDSVSAAFKYGEGRTCILNFASFKEPGGMFLKGSIAQEEALCHESFLYNVLAKKQTFYDKNKTMLNRGLYKNRALYSPDIIFKHKGTARSFDVLTCAAPNFSVAGRYQKVSVQENNSVLRSRIEFVLSIIADMNAETFVFGAYGCGGAMCC